MTFYKIDDQIVISDKALSVGTELTANTTDGAHEKHVPVIEQDGDTVTKSRVTSMKFFDGDENIKEKSVRKVDSWNINDPNIPGWLKKHLK